MKVNIVKTSILLSFLALTINVCTAHVSLNLGIGLAPQQVYIAQPPGPVYYSAAPGPYYAPPPGPYYAAPPPAPYYAAPQGIEMVWVPSHLEYGYWVPGRYVQYAVAAPGPGYFWAQGGWDNFHHWHHGDWRRGR